MRAENVALIGGPPGSGKSSVAKSLSLSMNIAHISVGDRIRSIAEGVVVSNYSESIKLENQSLQKSKKLPQNLVCAVIAEAFEQPEVNSNILLDGYPRSPEQIEPLIDTFHQIGANALIMVYLHVDREKAIQRMVERGSRSGEVEMDARFAHERYDSYVESHEGFLTLLANEMPVEVIDANADLEKSIRLARAALSPVLKRM